MSSQVVVKYVENSALLHQKKKVQMYLPTLLKCEMRGTSGFKMHLKETKSKLASFQVANKQENERMCSTAMTI